MDVMPSLSQVRELLTHVLTLAGMGSIEATRVQVSALRGVSGPITMLQLDVPADAPLLDLPDDVRGPIVESDVVGGNGNALGGIMLWAPGKRLNTLEIYWFTDDRPTELPNTAQVVASPAR